MKLLSYKTTKMVNGKEIAVKRTLHLNEKGTKKVKEFILGVTCASFLVVGMMGAIMSDRIDADDVTYEKVFISSVHDSEFNNAADAIVKLNSNVDYRDLIPFFEEANDIASAGRIQEGFYLVPVYKEK